MAAAAAFSSIVTPSSSSSSLAFFPCETSLNNLSPNYFPSPKTKPFLKTLTLKSQNYIISSLPVLFPLHLCYSSSVVNDIEDSITDELEENPDEFEQDQEDEEEEEEGDESKEVQFEENKGFDSYDDRRIFVGNLPYSMTSTQLSEVFADAGQVQSVEVYFLVLIFNFIFVIILCNSDGLFLTT